MSRNTMSKPMGRPPRGPSKRKNVRLAEPLLTNFLRHAKAHPDYTNFSRWIETMMHGELYGPASRQWLTEKGLAMEDSNDD